ncbi:MAG: extracellular solute-binding protein [Oscillospiraceae bacterium]
METTLKKRIKTGVSILLALMVTTGVTLRITPVDAENDDKTLEERLEVAPVGDSLLKGLPYYTQFLSEYENYEIVQNVEAKVEGNQYTSYEGKKPEQIDESSILSVEDTDRLTWTIKAPKTGLYNIEIIYKSASASIQSPQRSLFIDEKQTFYEENTITLPRYWKDESAPKINQSGDEIRVNPLEITDYFSIRVRDNFGKHSEPLLFYLEEGEHKISIGYISQDVVIKSVGIVSANKYEDYKTVSDGYKMQNSKESMRFEAEDYNHILCKNDATVSIAGSSDPTASPYSASQIRLNFIGGSSWYSGGQEIVWKFNVPSDGLYKINLRVLQNYSDGLPVYRKIKINGKVPFREMQEYRFDYAKSWDSKTLSDDNANPYLFELKSGENTISMTVVQSEYTQIVETLLDTSKKLSTLIFDITMITGQNPDVNYDYGLNEEIPGLTDQLESIKSKVYDCEKRIGEISNKQSAMRNNLQRIVKDIEKLIQKPDNIVPKMADLNTMLTDMSDYAAALQNSCMGIDYIEMLPLEAFAENPKATFFQRASATFVNLVASFSKEYNSIGSIYNGEADAEPLDVWVCLGKEWGQILKEMTDTGFSPENNINVKMNMLPSGSVTSTINPLLLALGAGRGPDVVLGLTYNYPVEYAIRNALYNLSSFDDYSDVSSRFLEPLMIPYKFEGGAYALPETMSFRALYYRTDIFKNLNLSVPKTWNEIYDILLPALNQNNMTMYIPQIIDPFLYQLGGSYYRNDGQESNLDTPEGFAAFDEFCKLYTDYGIPVAEDFYSRFRTGDIPVGIMDASMYLKFSYAAPEIAGNWAMMPIPGHVKQDGSIDNSNSGLAVNSCVIINDCKNPDSAWEFLKWWTSAQTQKNYSAQVESRLGSTARWISANSEAFWSLSWSKQDKVAIKAAFENSVETPVVRGGYFTNRHLVNAINRAVVQKEPTRSSLEEAVEEINKELKRRRKKA